MKLPAFTKGVCFMAETLSKAEVEALGPMVAEAICDCARYIVEDQFDPDTIEDQHAKARVLFSILTKIDYPAPDHFWGEDATVDRAYQDMKAKLLK